MKDLFYIDEFTPLGPLRIISSSKFIVSVFFLEKNNDSLNNLVIKNNKLDILQKASLELKQWFCGDRISFDLPLFFEGTCFQKKVWNSLIKIPFGETRSYSDIAIDVGNSNAYRAVGTAIASNPILIFVPCHRVIGSNKTLRGFSSGLWRKKILLSLECYRSKL
ncbi:methylated-DNA-[protein]-cysteine S-methyltransferase [Candidatus Kinetoplastibacterium desouzaii TCC079E]|uniref:methylated-DNA--[protein]-cysteine S-methyltransferase n=1 Tax=Candidatus Kinetoplastidibacterium desouzai TCC079E TaxID=1208919 RepID=M1M4T7_9PROT|nr:methylated-DNA--[protein]-cysteine S-methyltransferase [Candidatus Kinetoplastibacterium desouzaii]AGF47205.1 methylated-DNA-[protein]-cysteine S-methyltransferase [Candidatus Kinetoplastibacterium desouzaii TCC079E]